MTFTTIFGGDLNNIISFCEVARTLLTLPVVSLDLCSTHVTDLLITLGNSDYETWRLYCKSNNGNIVQYWTVDETFTYVDECTYFDAFNKQFFARWFRVKPPSIHVADFVEEIYLPKTHLTNRSNYSPLSHVKYQ